MRYKRFFSRLIITIFLLNIFLSCSLSFASVCYIPINKISLEITGFNTTYYTHDFGPVNLNNTYYQCFEIKNLTSQPLEICPVFNNSSMQEHPIVYESDEFSVEEMCEFACGCNLGPLNDTWALDSESSVFIDVSFTPMSEQPEELNISMYYYGPDSGGILNLTIKSGCGGTAEQIVGLIEKTEGMNLQQGIENNLDAKLNNVLDALNAENADQRNDAINKMEAFINAVEAQRDNKITNEQAEELITIANDIINCMTSQ